MARKITYKTYEHAMRIYDAFNEKNRFLVKTFKENYAVKHAIEILKLYAIQNDIIVSIRGRFFNQPKWSGCSERIRF